MKLPNLTFCGGRERKTTNLRFLFLNFETVLQNLTPEKIANIWQIEQHGKSALEFEAERTHYLSDVSLAVAVIVSA